MRSVIASVVLLLGGVVGGVGCIHIHTEAPRIPGCPPCPCQAAPYHLSASEAPDARPDAPASLGAPKPAVPTAAPASPQR